jgi:exodeoxyribonuclease VII large subunit
MSLENKEKIWPVGALCRSVADALQARFNPVSVRGEISGLTRPASGHLYFTLKDDAGQLRCAMFKRAASQLDFVLKEGEQVEVKGRLDVYPPRGDLQLVVEGVRRAGQGLMFEQFLRRKQMLEAQGLFDTARKRPLARFPRAVGLVTSLSAAALQDVATALQRRSPHVPVYVAPAAVQGESAAQELVGALRKLYRLIEQGYPLDVILLVRGGGSIEDLWCFNDEDLVRTVVASPVPVVTGVGHETDFTLVDFCADLRAPTPTAAAELAVTSRQACTEQLDALAQTLRQSLLRRLDHSAQSLDRLTLQMGQVSHRIAAQKMDLYQLQASWQSAVGYHLQQLKTQSAEMQSRLMHARQRTQDLARERVAQAGLRLQLLDPQRVLQRGYTWLQDSEGQPLTSVAQAKARQKLRAILRDGTLDLSVTKRELN